MVPAMQARTARRSTPCHQRKRDDAYLSKRQDALQQPERALGHASVSLLVSVIEVLGNGCEVCHLRCSHTAAEW